MQIVIGLDIGSYSIKAVEIVNTFNSYEIANFYENVIPEIPEVSADILLPACMEQLFSENGLKADRIITAIRGQYISSRIMSFNFSDPRKIQSAITAEVEDHVPFTMDDMILDHQILGSAGGKTLALAVMTRKVFLKNFLEHLQKIHIDPKLVDIDSLALYNLSSHIAAPEGQCYGLVDIGHEKTSVCLVQNGLLKMFRSINLGGRYISEFLARDLEVEFTEAQRIKHRVSRILCSADPGTDLNEADRMVAERVALATNSIVKELGRTLYAFKTYEKTPVTQIFLSGGTSRLKNIDRFLEEQLEVPVCLNRLENTPLKINPALHRHMEIMPQSVAIGLRAVSSVKRHSQINMRRGEFAYVQDYEQILRWANTVAKVVAVAFVLLFVAYGVRWFAYRGQISTLQKRYVDDFKTTFTDANSKKIIAPNISFTKIRGDVTNRILGEVKQQRSAVDEFLKQNSGSAALQVLLAISEKIPKDVKIDVTLFQFNSTPDGGGVLVLKGETDGYASMTSIIESLKTMPSLKDVTEKASGAKPGTNNTVIEFTIQATYTGPSPSEKKA